MAGRYRVDRLIGEGGSAEVYEASMLGASGFVRRVALKRLKAELAAAPERVAEFEAEARLVSRLHHANVVAMLDYATIDGVPTQVLEHVDGLDLLRLEAHARQLGQPLATAFWVAAVAEAAHGLDYVHGARDEAGRALHLVHRDVSPSNVLVAWSGEVKVSDFGIALSAEARPRTQVGVVKGKLEYLSPEQLRGEGVDGRADVFALGCVLHRMVSGRGLMEDEGTRQRVTAGEAALIGGGVPSALAELIAQAVAPDPARRTPSAAALGEDCARWLASQGVVDGRLVVREAMAALRPARELLPEGPLAALATVPPLEDEASMLTVAPGVRSSVTAGASDAGLTAVEVAGAAELIPDGPTTRASQPRAFEEVTDPVEGESDTVALRYEVIAPLASGGFAEVFRARAREGGPVVALKVLRADRGQHGAASARFDREAEALARIESPYLVRLLESGRMPDGRPWLAMELLRGRTLADELHAARGPLPHLRVRRLARDLALGLAALHEADIVHRDLGARNVMLVEAGGREKAMIIDLGHARWIEGGPEVPLTQPGMVLGNARWMAPEQVHDPSRAGPAADLYSLGLLMLAMITGRPPFVGSPATVLALQLGTMPEIPPSPFSALIRRMIDKDPARRFSSATAVAAELTQIVVPTARDLALGVAVVPPPEAVEAPRVAPPAPVAGPREPPGPLVAGARGSAARVETVRVRGEARAAEVFDDRTVPMPPRAPAAPVVVAPPVSRAEPARRLWLTAAGVVMLALSAWALVVLVR